MSKIRLLENMEVVLGDEEIVENFGNRNQVRTWIANLPQDKVQAEIYDGDLYIVFRDGLVGESVPDSDDGEFFRVVFATGEKISSQIEVELPWEESEDVWEEV